MYAIIDIETTGGRYNEEGITEIAIYKFDGDDVVDSFITLVNPEKEIQPFVVNLTGINTRMLRDAPKFHEIAKRVVEITKDCILVAHNTSFDYRILKTEFRRLGYDFDVPTLCTIELSKQLIPDQESYSLGKLCRKLGIPVSDRHRANGDAIATLKLLQLLLIKDKEKQIVKHSVKRGNHRDLSKKFLSILDGIPVNTGVFYFHKYNGEIIYIGRGKNIQKKVNSVFLQVSKKSRAMFKEISSVTYDLTGSELITQLKYHEDLHTHKPKYNTRERNSIVLADFSNPNMVLIDRGRHVSEKSVILIENNEYKGYGYTDLGYQINNLEVLQKIVSAPKQLQNQNNIINKFLLNNKIEKFIRF